jgi:hypothetical protein
MYQLEDVTHLLDEVRTIIRQHVVADLDKVTQQSVLYLRQLFLQAEGNGVALNVDLSQLDDASVKWAQKEWRWTERGTVILAHIRLFDFRTVLLISVFFWLALRSCHWMQRRAVVELLTSRQRPCAAAF